MHLWRLGECESSLTVPKCFKCRCWEFGSMDQILKMAVLYLLVDSKVLMSAGYREALRKYWQNISKYIVKFAEENPMSKHLFK